MITLEELNYEIFANKLCPEMSEYLKVKVLETRFKNVVLGRCQPPDP
jgi:hypothetical protein